jgi:imidazolonepropionase-like amidohydrolase
MQDLGAKPMAILMAATRNVAKAYKVDRDVGTLERGRLADLLVLNLNPLEDARNYRAIHLIMKEGRIIDRDNLPTERLLTAPVAASA